jgi:hypothetical protein
MTPSNATVVFSNEGENFLASPRICRKDVGKGFRILIKKITEPVRRPRDESNNTN